MSMSITQILLVIIAAVLFLAISISWWVLNGNPQAMAMLTGIIPSLNQAEQLSLEQGFKAIHVKLTPDGSTETINEFHPTNDGALGRKHLSRLAEILGSDTYDYFFLNKFQTDKCYVFTTRYDSWVYSVNPGSQISKTSGNLVSDLIVENEGCVPQKGCKDSTPGEFTVCRDSTGINLASSKADCASSDKEKLKTSDYNFGVSVSDRCVENEDPCPYINGKRDCCAFAKTSSNQHVYEPAYNVLCGNEQGSPEARWYACTDNQYATISENGVQFTCDKGEWKCKSGCKLDILNPQIEYEFGPLVIDKTNLEFVVANNQNEEMKDVKIWTKVSDPESSVDCLGNTLYDTYVEKTTASIAKNGGTFKYSHDNFCYKAKTFNARIEYKIKENNADVIKYTGYEIECPNAKFDKEDLQKCTAKEVGWT